MSRHVVRVGVFIPADCQVLDQAAVDILASMSHEYLTLLAGILPGPVIELAPSVRIHYIGSVRAGEAIALTANQRIVATDHYADADVAPGMLDVVIVPGPDPRAEFAPEALLWLRRQAATPGTDLLCICTGILLCGAAGLLSGRRACGPRMLQDLLRERYGHDGVELVGHELRWVQDGDFWSSGSVTNANDLVAAYARHATRHFPAPVVEIVLDMVDVGDRPQRYGDEPMMARLVAEAMKLARGEE